MNPIIAVDVAVVARPAADAPPPPKKARISWIEEQKEEALNYVLLQRCSTSAEFGVAAHWDYKLGNKSDPTTSLTVKGGQSKAGLLLPPARTQDESPDSGLPIAGMGKGAVPVGPYVDALVTAKRNMMQQTVYVFLAGETEGKLISLPTNSLVRDAITALDGQNADGSDEPKLWLNGRTAYLDDSVVNGDVLFVT